VRGGYYGAVIASRLCAALAAGLIVNALALDRDNTATWAAWRGNSLLWLIVGGLAFWLVKRVITVHSRRVHGVSGGLALLFSTFETVGYAVDTTGSLSPLVHTPALFWRTVLYVIGLACLLHVVLVMIFTKYLPGVRAQARRAKHALKQQGSQLAAPTHRTANRSWFAEVAARPGRWLAAHRLLAALIAGLVMSLARLPYFFYLYPGVVTPDSYSQLGQTLGTIWLNNHHPIGHTAIIAPFTWLGETVGSMDVAVAAYSLFQIVLTSAAMTYAVWRINAWGVKRWATVAIYAFFTLMPIYGFYSVTMWKNIPFAAAMLVFVVMVVDILRQSSATVTSWRRLICLVVLMFLLSSWRNDGIFASLGAVIVLAIVLWHGQWRRWLACALALVACFGAYQVLVVRPHSNSGDSMREALSLPVQQIAATAQKTGANYPKAYRSVLKQAFGGLTADEVGKLYTPGLTDPVKSELDTDYISNNLTSFVKGYLKYGLAHPKAYITELLVHTHGYWYPEFRNAPAVDAVVSGDAVPTLQGRPYPDRDSPRDMTNRRLLEPRDVPIVSMAFSIGFGLMLLLVAAGALIIQRRYRLLAAFVPLGILLMTCMVSPMWGSYRYAWGYLITVPVMLALAFGTTKPRVSKLAVKS
jgi:Ca2+/Na+ antiporter